jgi:hypothetical protein
MHILLLPKSRGVDIFHSKILAVVAKYGIYNALILIAYEYDFDQGEEFSHLLNELTKFANMYENYELIWLIKYKWFLKALHIS